jgi:hypothetical protein
MATAGTIKAKLLKIYTGGTPAAITCLTNAELTVTNELREISCKDTGIYQEFLPDTQTWTISGEALAAFDAANGIDEISTIVLAQTETAIVFQTGVSGDTKWSGDVYFTSFNVTSGNTGNATFSFEAQGTGQLTQGTVT